MTTGSKVNRVILDLLYPCRRRPDPFQDIYLPWEYPHEFAAERSFFWSEYLLQAFPAFNREYEILFGTHALYRRPPKEFAELVPTIQPGLLQSAFRVRRSG